MAIPVRDSQVEFQKVANGVHLCKQGTYIERNDWEKGTVGGRFEVIKSYTRSSSSVYDPIDGSWTR